MKNFDFRYSPSLKCVLLRKGNQLACVTIGHSVVVKEHYLNVKMVLNKLGYNEHNWAICVDFKMVNFCRDNKGLHQESLFFLLLGQSSNYATVGKKGLAGT